MMGTASLALRRYDLARKSYETAIALDPDYVLALVNLGVTLSLMGHFNKAITHYQAGLKIDPNDINSINAMGNALQFKGEYDVAIESYSKAIALAPTCAEAHNNLGNASENQGNLQAAVKSYTQALVYQPENKATQNFDPRMSAARRNGFCKGSDRQTLRLPLKFACDTGILNKPQNLMLRWPN